MARPSCPKCENHRFKLTLIAPEGSNIKMNVLHCTSCGAVVGVVDYFDIGGMIQKIAKKLGV